MDDGFWAHVLTDSATQSPRPHALEEHLAQVAQIAGGFAPHGAVEWGRMAGQWHDLGKYREGFQKYIRSANGIEAHLEGRIKDADKTHSAAGALWAERVLTERHGPAGQMMSRVFQYVIAGHHAGLDNWDGGLVERLRSADARRELETCLAAMPPDAGLRGALPEFSLRDIPASNESGHGSVRALGADDLLGAGRR